MKKTVGHPRTFSSGDEMMQHFCDYLADLKANDFIEAPTKSNFAKWLVDTGRVKKCSRWTVYNYVERYFPKVKHKYVQMLSETLAEGAMLGKYHSSMTIFTLKNWCAWSDRPIEEDDSAQKLDAILTAIKEGV